MKVLHYLANIRLSDGGVVRAVIDLANGLSKQGHDVTVLTVNAPDSPDDWSSSGRPSVAMTRHRPPFNITFSAKEKGKLQELLLNSDVLHLHSFWSPASFQLAKFAARNGVPYVVTLHGVLDEWSMRQKAPKKRLYMEAIGRRLLSAAAAVHCTAAAELTQTDKWYPTTRGVVIPYLFDMGPFRTLPDPMLSRSALSLPSDNTPLVVFLSRLHYKKRPEILLEVASCLLKRGCRVHVVLAGSGDPKYEKALHNRAIASNVGPHVSFPGLVTDPLRSSLLSAADVFVLPTWQENFGFVLVEALAAGTPAVTTTGVDIWQELASGGGTIVLPSGPGNELIPSVADAVWRIVSDPSLRSTMSDHGRSHILTWLSEANVVKQYLQMYETALRTHLRPRLP